MAFGSVALRCAARGPQARGRGFDHIFHGPKGPFFHQVLRCPSPAPSTSLRVSACGLKLEDATISTPPREARVGDPGPAARGRGFDHIFHSPVRHLRVAESLRAGPKGPVFDHFLPSSISLDTRANKW